MHKSATVLNLETSTTATARRPPVPDRDELVQQGLPLVKAIADRLQRAYTLAASFDDLCAMGFTGLAAAVDRFDQSKGASFITFAYHKIRGAILDGLRRSNRQYSFETRCRIAAEHRAARLADDDELSTGDAADDDIEGSTAQIASSLCHVATLHLASVSGAGEEHPALDMDEEVDRRRLQRRVQEAIARLPDKEREVVEVYYYSDGSLADVSSKLGVSRGWASRLHKRALSAVQAALEEIDLEDLESRLTEVVPVAEITCGSGVSEGSSVPGLELELDGPAPGDVGAAALDTRHGCERMDLRRELFAPSIAAVGQHDIEPTSLGEEVGEAPRSLGVEDASGDDVARLLTPVPSLVADGVDGSLHEDKLAVGRSVPARRERTWARLGKQARHVVSTSHATEAPRIERSRRDADPLEHPPRLAAASGAIEVSSLRSSQIMRLVPQVLAISDRGANVSAPLVGAGDEQFQRGFLVEPLVPLEERRQRSLVRRRRCVGIRPYAPIRIPLQPNNLALLAGHRDVAAIWLGNRRDESPTRQKSRHVDHLLEAFQQRFIYSRVASCVRPRRSGAICCLRDGPAPIRGGPEITPRPRVVRHFSNAFMVVASCQARDSASRSAGALGRSEGRSEAHPGCRPWPALRSDLRGGCCVGVCPGLRAVGLATRLKDVIADEGVRVGAGKRVAMTASIGVATYPSERLGTGFDLLAAARRALDLAKAQERKSRGGHGRGSVVSRLRLPDRRAPECSRTTSPPLGAGSLPTRPVGRSRMGLGTCLRGAPHESRVRPTNASLDLGELVRSPRWASERRSRPA